MRRKTWAARKAVNLAAIAPDPLDVAGGQVATQGQQGLLLPAGRWRLRTLCSPP